MSNSNTLEIATERINTETIRAFADGILTALDQGEMTAMDVALRFKFFEDLIAATKDKLRPMVVDELMNYHVGEDIVKHNGQFKLKEAGVRYDFSNCNDPEWRRLTEVITNFTNGLKEREKFLRTITKPTTIVDEQTGEVVTINPPIKTSTTTYAITWSK